MLIKLGHSPDPDDAFMFWAIAAGAIDTRGSRFEQVLQDIQSLNEWALEGRLEVTAISLACVSVRPGSVRAAAARGEHRLRLRAILVAREPLAFESWDRPRSSSPAE